ncbi:MAG: hypothetical protein IJD48_00940, partial [Clostridia bacterium]|nr:hypothetical protein [Clostridia bacterium]
MKKIKSFKVLVCFLILTISFLFIGCSLIKEKKPQTSLTNQEIVAEAIQKTEKLLIESSNGKDSVNPTDIFFDENVNLQKNLRCFKVTNLDNVDETMRKTGILGTSTRIYQNVTAYLGIFDYVLNHFTSDDGYGINLEYNKVYKYNGGYNARFFKLIENKNDITLLVNDNTVLTIYCNKAKTQVLSVKVIDLKDNES